MTVTLYDEGHADASLMPNAGTGQNYIRATLFNLIVVAHNPERVAYCQKVIEIITKKFPCKIIFIRLDPNTQTDFVRTVSTLLTVDKGNNSVFCDQITIEASATQFYKIPFLILPHLRPDMPIYLFLDQDPIQDTVVVPEMQKYATRIIFDPEAIANFCSFSQDIENFSKKLCCDLVDLNWARIKAWREILARVFSAKENLEQLYRSKTIQITYVSAPNVHNDTVDIQAVYLQAWLASRLKWELVSIERDGNCTRISYKYDHNSLTVSLISRDCGMLVPGTIFSFEAMTHNDYHFLITHEHDNKLVKVHSSNPERCDIPYTIFLTNFQNGPALVSEAFYQLQSEHYECMLGSLANNAWSR